MSLKLHRIALSEHVEVASDEGADYRIEEIGLTEDGTILAVTSRIGKSGKAFAAREISGDGLAARYVVSDSDQPLDLAVIVESLPQGTLSKNLDGSITDVVSRHCASLVRELQVGMDK